MGGMETWIFAVKYPDYMDVAVPMACLPTEMSSRNWMLRRLITDSIRNDPEWKGGQYTQQPKSARFASVYLRDRDQRRQPGALQGGADAGEGGCAAGRPPRGAFPADANDVLYQWDSSRDYNPSPGLEKIKATVLAINAADDERNPPELGLLDREIKRVKNGRVLLIPASENTRDTARRATRSSTSASSRNCCSRRRGWLRSGLLSRGSRARATDRAGLRQQVIR